MADVQEVRSFWFGTRATTPAEFDTKARRWFMGGADLDREIIERFTGDVERALAGELDGWAAEPPGRVALVLLLDQFPRSVFRGTPRSVAGDERAQRLVLEAFDQGIDRGLPHEERLFLIMPLMHSEDMALQERGAKLVDELIAIAPDYRSVYDITANQSKRYREIVGRYGRFPHRNESLGRTSTPEEIEFMRTWEYLPDPPKK